MSSGYIFIRSVTGEAKFKVVKVKNQVVVGIQTKVEICGVSLNPRPVINQLSVYVEESFI